MKVASLFLVAVLCFFLPSAACGDFIYVTVDNLSAQPLKGDTVWYYNSIQSDRGVVMGSPNWGAVTWKKGSVRIEVLAQGDLWVGIWEGLNHPVRENLSLNFSDLIPQLLPAYKSRVKGLRVKVNDGRGKLQIELQSPNQSIAWRETHTLKGGAETVDFSLPSLSDIRSLNALILGSFPAFVEVDDIALLVETPSLKPAERAFLYSYCMLLGNLTQDGLVRDRSNFGASEFDNISAGGMLALAAVTAWRLGMISEDTAIEIVKQITSATLALSTKNGLLPHFLKQNKIVAGSEFSSIDTFISYISLLLSNQSLGLPTEPIESALKAIDFEVLQLPDGTISHGFNYDGQLIPYGWDYGGEAFIANWVKATVTGQPAKMEVANHSFNGSGFIDFLHFLLVKISAPYQKDVFGVDWSKYVASAVDKQIHYYDAHPCYALFKLWGLSAGEYPKPDAVDPAQIYQAFGVGGAVAANDGSELLGGQVVTPHYPLMVMPIRPNEAIAMFEALEKLGVFSLLNNLESLMITGDNCDEIYANQLRGSWNLGLQCLGVGHYLMGDDDVIYKAGMANKFLRKGIQIMIPPTADFNHDGEVSFSDFLLFAAVFGQKVDGQNAGFDLDTNDVSIDFQDFLKFATVFGQKL